MTSLPLTSIRVDSDVQPRETISNDIVAEYRDDMKRGDRFPPVVVFRDREHHYWLADGFHRYNAAADLGLKAIRAQVRLGSRRDAMLFACGANADHGLRRTNSDKRRSVTKLLIDAVWGKWSHNKIAKLCGVDHKTVSDVADSLRASGILGTSQDGRRRLAERNGKVYTVDTANIGGKGPADEEPDRGGEVSELLSALAEEKARTRRREPMNPYADDPTVMWLPDPPEPHSLTSATAALGSARFVPKAHNRKLGPRTTTPGRERPHVVALPPFVAVTYASIEGTCPASCIFLGRGCYAEAGPENFQKPALDPGVTPFDVIAEEVRLIDAYDPSPDKRDLRLHDGGDAPTEECAQLLAGAARRWRERGGGSVWTYTHAWRTVPRAAWGPVSVLASVEDPADIEAARAQGYASAIVVERFERSDKRIVPCVEQTQGKTCVECRLCFDDRKLLEKNIVIAFKVHGQHEAAAREALVQLRKVKP